MDADGSEQRQLTHATAGEGPVAWLPDGRIVYSSFHGNGPLPSWFLMNPDGTGVRSLPQLQGAGDPIDWLVPYNSLSAKLCVDPSRPRLVSLVRPAAVGSDP